MIDRRMIQFSFLKEWLTQKFDGLCRQHARQRRRRNPRKRPIRLLLVDWGTHNIAKDRCWLDSNALPKLEHTRCRVNRQNALFHPATCGIIQHLGNHRVSGMDIHKTLAPDKGQRVATAVTASEPFPMRRDAAC